MISLTAKQNRVTVARFLHYSIVVTWHDLSTMVIRNKFTHYGNFQTKLHQNGKFALISMFFVLDALEMGICKLVTLC